MVDSSRTFRVALLQSMRDEVHYPLVVRVLEFGAQAEHWRFVGHGTTPFVMPERLDELPIDGLIGLIDDPELAERASACCRAVVNTATSLSDVGLAVVGSDERAIGRMGAEHLLERGFSHFGFVDDADDPASTQQRLGFEQAVAIAGRRLHVISRSWTNESDSRPHLSAWLAAVPKPIAVMAHNDHYARLTTQAAKLHDLRLPDDVAVMGVNNNPWSTAMAPVPLTSIELNMREIGYQAAKTLDGLLAGEALPPPRLVPPIGVVTRRSTDVVLADDPVASAALRYIRDHVGNGINVEDVLNELDLSRSTLVNRMKQAVGCTPHQAIVRARIEAAKKLLLSTDAPMDEIARRCGFLRQPRLNETFKRITGLTPGQFRNQQSR